MSKPTLHTYTVQTSAIPAGTLRIKVRATTVGFTVPTEPTVINIEPITESLDLKTGDLDLPTTRFTVIDDYTVYDEGFWHKALSFYAEIVLFLDPGDGEEVIFWGKISRDTVEMVERHKSGNDYVRVIEFEAVDFLVTLKDVTTDELIAELKANWLVTVNNSTLGAFPVGGHNEYFVKFQSIFAAMLKLIDSGGIYTGSEIQVDAGDARFYADTPVLAWKDIDESVAMWVGDDTPSDPTYEGYWDPAITGYWKQRYGDAFALLTRLAKNFLFAPRLVYKPDTTEFYMVLMSRGRDGTDYITLDTPITSAFYSEAYELVKTVKSNHRNTTDSTTENYRFVNRGTYLTENEEDIDVDINVVKDFEPDLLERAYDTNYPWDYMYFLTADPYLRRISDGQCYDYNAGAYSNSQSFINQFYYTRFGYAKTAYEREYPSLKGNNGVTDHFLNVHLGCRTQITYAISYSSTTTKNYYAQQIRRDVLRNRTFIRWVEI